MPTAVAPAGTSPDNHSVRANFRVIPNDDRAKDLGAGAGNNAIAQGRMTLSLVPSSSPKRYSMVKGHIVADLRRFADNHAHTVIDEESPPNSGRWVDFDTSQPSSNMRNEAP